MSSQKLGFGQAVIGSKSSRTKKKSVGRIAVPSVGKVSNGTKGSAKKSGGKRIY